MNKIYYFLLSTSAVVVSGRQKIGCISMIQNTVILLSGSHNSFAYCLDRTSPVSPDIKGTLIDKAARFLPRAKQVICNWSITQTLDFHHQLEAGIRYFDLRVSILPGVQSADELYLIHGLYGIKLEEAMKDIKAFLDKYPREVVIMDFNHFYEMNHGHHWKCVKCIDNIFRGKLCPQLTKSNIQNLTLNHMWENNYQVITVYHESSMVKEKTELWPGCTITSPWHNTATVADLFRALENMYNKRKATSTNTSQFHVSQGVLTPIPTQILSRITSTLKIQCGQIVSQTFVDWLKSKQPGQGGLNICIMDFVEMNKYIETVIKLNDKLLPQT